MTTEDEPQAEPGASHDLVYKVHTQTEEAPTPVTDEVLSPLLIDVIDAVISEERERHRAERERALAVLRSEIAELRGQVTALLTLVQGAAKADVVSLSGARKLNAS